MTTVERSGASIEEVIRAYCKEFKIRDWELRYDIISKPSAGFLGFIGKRQARLRFHQEELHVRIKHFVDKLLSEMGVGFSELKSRYEGKNVYVDVIGCSDPGFLIGKNGSMLETIQFLANRTFESDRSLDRVYVDLDGYRERREAQFLRQYIPQIRDVHKSGKTLTLPLMSPADRRVIHRYIESQKSLRTLTVGEGDKKRVVVFSSKVSERDALAHAKGDQPSPEAEAPKEKRAPRPPRKNTTERQPATERPVEKPKDEQDAATPPKKKVYRRPPRKAKDAKETT